MSLILEALKKLEREKKTPERGFLVTTAAAWPSRGESRLRPVHVAVGLAAAVVALGGWLAFRVPVPRPAAAAPAAAPAPRAEPTLRPLPVPPPPARPAVAAPPATVPRRTVDSKPAAAPAVSAAPVAPTDAPPPAEDAELRLQAVSRKDGRPVAVLSGRLVHEGDAFDDVRVLRIGEAEVEIEVGGKRRVLGF